MTNRVKILTTVLVSTRLIQQVDKKRFKSLLSETGIEIPRTCLSQYLLNILHHRLKSIYSTLYI